MNDQEKEIQKYKEQGRKKKKGQIAAEPEKYVIEEDKMIGSPDMLTADEKRRFLISAMSRKFGTAGILAVIIGPLAMLLSLGAAEMMYSSYTLGASFNKMAADFYRPFFYVCTGFFFAVVALAWIVHHFVYSDKKNLIVRADDKIVEAGMEPVVIPRLEKDRNRLIEAFYKVKPPYHLSYVLFVLAIAALLFGSVVVFRAAAEQKVITDKARDEVAARIEDSLSGFDHTTESSIMTFVDRRTYKVGNVTMTIDIDENGKVLDSSYMLRYSGKYKAKQLDELKAEGVIKEFQTLQDTTKEYKDLFVYPTVTEVPVQFSDYMVNYIDNIREESSWDGEQECKVGDDEYIMHCGVSYSEGKDKASKDDDRMTITYEIQKKDFKRTQW